MPVGVRRHTATSSPASLRGISWPTVCFAFVSTPCPARIAHCCPRSVHWDFRSATIAGELVDKGFRRILSTTSASNRPTITYKYEKCIREHPTLYYSETRLDFCLPCSFILVRRSNWISVSIVSVLGCDEDMKRGAHCLPPILVVISSRKQGVALSSAKRDLRQRFFTEKCSANAFAPAEANEECLRGSIATPSTSSNGSRLYSSKDTKK